MGVPLDLPKREDSIYLSKHFTIDEFERSDYAIRHDIDNSIPEEFLLDTIQLCQVVLEPLREKLGKGIHITSGYRCPELNTAIGGASSSQHTKGQAADIVVYGLSVTDVVEVAKSLPIFDQLIHEFDRWTHISYRRQGGNRKQVLRAVRQDGKTVYLSYL